MSRALPAASLAETRRSPEMTEPKMTADELEQERADLLDAIEAGEPLTPEMRDRIAAVAEADSAHPPSPFEEAMHEILAEIAVLSDRTLPPGLAIRSDGGSWTAATWSPRSPGRASPSGPPRSRPSGRSPLGGIDGRGTMEPRSVHSCMDPPVRLRACRSTPGPLLPPRSTGSSRRGPPPGLPQSRRNP
jgi:hypothetical protein